MCGIVGIIGDGLIAKHRKMFSDLLRMDTIRGDDSTGFFVADGKDVVSAKKAIDGIGFTNMSMYSKRLASVISPKLLVGHNRAATKGKVTDGNAHPFKKDGTLLVHNGSLTTWKTLHGASETEVDSEAVCFNVAHEGFKKTLEKLNGPFTIVTYDEETKIVQLARNEERPLWFANDKTADILYFASERGMLVTAAERNFVEIEEPWEFKTGCIMSFDIGNTGKKVLETRGLEEDVKLYVAPTTYRLAPPVNNYQNYNKNNNSYVPPSKKLTTLETLGLKAGQKVAITPKEFLPYSPGNSGNGAVTASLYTLGSFPEHICDTKVFQITKEFYDEHYNDTWICEAVSTTVFEKEAIPYSRFVKIMDEEEEEEFWDNHFNSFPDIDEFGIEDKVRDTIKLYESFGGQSLMQEEYDDIAKHGCCMCGDPLPTKAEDTEDMSWVTDNEPMCGKCTNAFEAEASRLNIPLQEYIEGVVF